MVCTLGSLSIPLGDSQRCSACYARALVILLFNSADYPEILANIALIGRAVSTIEPRFTTRVLRTLTALRKKLTRPALKDALTRAFPKGCEYWLS